MSEISMIDIGANLTHTSFEQDLDAVLERARMESVSWIVVTGSSLESSTAAIELSKAYPEHLRATVGVHPHEAESFGPKHVAMLEQLSVLPQVVALGEMGLDYNRNYSSKHSQLAAFEQQLEVAVQHSLPVFLHERDAAEDMIRLLSEYRSKLRAGVVHCFTGDKRTLDAYLEMDMHIGITGWICDERRGTHLRELVSSIPRNRLMLETDAPYLMPRDHPNKKQFQSGRRNEPCTLPHIANTVAECRGETIADLCNHTSATSRAFFSLS